MKSFPMSLGTLLSFMARLTTLRSASSLSTPTAPAIEAGVMVANCPGTCPFQFRGSVCSEAGRARYRDLSGESLTRQSFPRPA